MQAGGSSSVLCCAWQHLGNAKLGRLPFRHGKILVETINRLCIFIRCLHWAYQHTNKTRESSTHHPHPKGAILWDPHEPTWNLGRPAASIEGGTVQARQTTSCRTGQGRAHLSKSSKSINIATSMWLALQRTVLIRPRGLTQLPEKFYVHDASIFLVSTGSLESPNIQAHSYMCTASRNCTQGQAWRQGCFWLLELQIITHIFLPADSSS